MDIATILNILDTICTAGEAAAELAEKQKGKYGIIHKHAFIKYRGREGRLVWDYILMNELTFEDSETGKQYSFGLSASDKKTEALFNELVERYGI